MNNKKMLLVHMSDVHVWRQIPQDVKLATHFRDFKRYQGYLNLKYRRGTNKYPPQQFARALQDVVQHIDKNHHLIISGDVTNLSMPHEFEYCKEILQKHYVQPLQIEHSKLCEHVTMVPGNHDAYVRKYNFLYC